MPSITASLRTRALGAPGARILLSVILLALLAATPLAARADALSATEFEFTFESGAEGWTTGFADLPADWGEDLYELDSGHRQLPAGLLGGAIHLQGHNRNDDLFMFLKRPIDGLVPDATYDVTFTIRLATNVPEGLSGIGGSPGESVYVKAGATAVEPIVIVDDSNHLRMNLEKGNQATEGKHMINLGNVAHPDVIANEYRIKTLDNLDRPLEAVSDSAGRLWLIAGTDSGFEGLTSVFYDSISVTLTPVDTRPIALPKTGGPSLPDWAFAAMAIMGFGLVTGSAFACRKLRP